MPQTFVLKQSGLNSDKFELLHIFWVEFCNLNRAILKFVLFALQRYFDVCRYVYLLAVELTVDETLNQNVCILSREVGFRQKYRKQGQSIIRYIQCIWNKQKICSTKSYSAYSKPEFSFYKGIGRKTFGARFYSVIYRFWAHKRD